MRGRERPSEQQGGHEAQHLRVGIARQQHMALHFGRHMLLRKVNRIGNHSAIDDKKPVASSAEGGGADGSPVDPDLQREGLLHIGDKRIFDLAHIHRRSGGVHCRVRL